MTAQDASYGQPEPLDGAMLAQCLDGVLAAGGCEAAAGRCKGRDAKLVDTDGQNKQECSHPSYPVERQANQVPESL